MSTTATLDGVLKAVLPLIEAGAALHWLVPRDKMPIEKDWSSRPVYTADQLRASYRAGANVGLRTGEPSRIDGLYLHVLDLDIRRQDTAPAAWAALLYLLPSARSLPSVISGSGGESRHIYFLTAQPLRSKTLVKSAGFEMVPDPKKGRDVKKFDWQIEIKGSGTQVAIPPSIHPSGNPYRWERPLDLDFPMLMEVDTTNWNVATVRQKDFDDDDLEVLMRQEPLDLDEERIQEIVDALPEEWYDERQLWLDVGMALHHQFRGSDRGFNIWCDWSEQSPKYDEKNSVVVWLSFKGNPNPKTFRTLLQVVKSEQIEEKHSLVSAAPIDGDLDDLLGDSATHPPSPPPAATAVISEPPENWKQLFHLDTEGLVKTTLHNLGLIARYDRRIYRTVAMNEFTQEIVLRWRPTHVKHKRERPKPVINLEGPIWQIADELNGDNWTDSHDIAVRAMIEAPDTQGGYALRVTDRDLKGAIDMAAQQWRFHPVRDLISSLVWDGRPRAETLFIDYLGCEDNDYYRQAALMTLVGAVARVFRPGHKFDFVPILEGVQGKGKSTFIKILGLHWFNELTGDISDPKQMVEVMQGTWILEIGELSAMQRSEVNDLKAFVSRTHDKVRLAWEKRAKVYPRQCIFIGSTNDREYLRDMTGGRRFWPIVCHLDGQIDNPRLRREVVQIWAEAVHIFKQMEKRAAGEELPLFLTEKAAEQALEMQESRRVETSEEMLAGKIQAWLDTPLGAEFDDLDADAPKVLRQETCVQQIWEEMLGKDGSVPHTEAIKIGRAMLIVDWFRTAGPSSTHDINKKYGKCRVYRRPKKYD